MLTGPGISDRNRFEDNELRMEQVEDLLRLQKAAQQISSILDLDQLTRLSPMWRGRLDVLRQASTCTTKRAKNWCWPACAAAPSTAGAAARR